MSSHPISPWFLYLPPGITNTVFRASEDFYFFCRIKSPKITLRLNIGWRIVTYEGCPEIIQPFWISREPVAWPWCNLAASQRRPYCASVKSLSRGASQWAVRRRCLSFVYCVTVGFTMTQRADQLHHDNAPAHSTSVVQAFFLAKHHITQVCQPPCSSDLAPCDFWLFPKLKSPFKGRRVVDATVTQYTSPITGVSLPTD